MSWFGAIVCAIVVKYFTPGIEPEKEREENETKD